MATRIPISVEIDYPEWQPQYEAAVLELDSKNLPQRIQDAQAALFIRLPVLRRSPDREPEKQAIENALGAIAGINARIDDQAEVQMQAAKSSVCLAAIALPSAETNKDCTHVCASCVQPAEKCGCHPT